MTFPYQRYSIAPTLTFPAGVLFRPEIPIRVRGPQSELSLFGLVDTGADETILPRSLAEELGIPIDDSNRSLARGFTGDALPVTYAAVHFEIRGDDTAYRWSSTVGFCAFQKPEDEAIVLGHAGCLEFLNVAFDGELHELALHPTKASHGILVWC